jgi:hypothetical protein
VRLQAHKCGSLLALSLNYFIYPLNCDQLEPKSGSKLPQSKAPSAQNQKLCGISDASLPARTAGAPGKCHI